MCADIGKTELSGDFCRMWRLAMHRMHIRTYVAMLYMPMCVALCTHMESCLTPTSRPNTTRTANFAAVCGTE